MALLAPSWFTLWPLTLCKNILKALCQKTYLNISCNMMITTTPIRQWWQPTSGNFKVFFHSSGWHPVIYHGPKALLVYKVCTVTAIYHLVKKTMFMLCGIVNNNMVIAIIELSLKDSSGSYRNALPSIQSHTWLHGCAVRSSSILLTA